VLVGWAVHLGVTLCGGFVGGVYYPAWGGLRIALVSGILTLCRCGVGVVVGSGVGVGAGVGFGGCGAGDGAGSRGCGAGGSGWQRLAVSGVQVPVVVWLLAL
jgi:hypothetical protein